ncbi:succinylglutamate desuccinylase [Andreprevotia chitinilytica]|uniref:succinylglutamate desuccinylase n=1 Tax=Andreprevotia chitinilytica TaxID=396808 RepID=UPI00055425B2|nr:succinylglutamate desuccinylase [Andreprevotia chitinilytica]
MPEALLADFLAFTLAGEAPAVTAGEAAVGVQWRWLGAGLLALAPAALADDAPRIVLSAGVHGDETAPVELLNVLAQDIAAGKAALQAHLLIVLGNVAAMQAGCRYLDDDLNRLFGGVHLSVPNSTEAGRAAELEACVARFFEAGPGARWHLDLHTAIRPSVFERFALLPQREAAYGADVFAWLGAFGIEAVLMHRTGSATFSHYCSHAHGALACTLELGKVMPFGQNDLSRFAAAASGLRRLIAGAAPADGTTPPRCFDVVGQLDKRSDAFKLLIGDDVANFTPYAQGTPIARDGEQVWTVQHAEERIVFPNAKVKVGLRAGLLVAELPVV